MNSGALPIDTITIENAFLDRLVALERLSKRDQLVQKHPEAEAVDLLGVLLLAVVLHDFWRHEAFRSTEALAAACQDDPAYSIIGHLDQHRIVWMILGVRIGKLEHVNVLRLQIAINHASSMQVLQGKSRL